MVTLAAFSGGEDKAVEKLDQTSICNAGDWDTPCDHHKAFHLLRLSLPYDLTCIVVLYTPDLDHL